jgi:O-antigen/teichoic acid export membrane protein
VVSRSKRKDALGWSAAIYGGALILPRLAAFAALVIFSRLLTPAEYGYFALFVISAELMNAVLFNWFRLGLLRLYPECEKGGRTVALRRTSLTMTGLATLASLPIGAAMALIAAPERWAQFFLLLAVLTLANGVVRLRLTELQAQQRALGYFFVELSRSLLSVLLSLAAVYLLGPHFDGLAAGFTGASLLVALICVLPYAGDFAHLTLDRALVRDIVAYAGPIVPITLLEQLIPLTERYAVQIAAGPAAVGVYAAAQNLVQQPINMLCSAVALAAFPIVMHSVERDGTAGAQSKMREVGGLLLALALPAAVGLIMLRSEIVSVVLGEEFRADAVTLIPILAVTALLTNFKYHYFDMVFHVARRLLLQVMTLLPPTLLTAPLIYLFVNLWGLPGAALGSCLAFAVSLAASWIVGRRLFVIPHALGDIARIAASVAAMGAVLWAIPPVQGLLGLTLEVVAGASAYIGTAFCFNVLNARKVAASYLAQLQLKQVGAS